MKDYVNFIKKFFFQNVKFLLIFFIDIITPVISSTQIACYVMCVQNVIAHRVLQSTEKKLFSSTMSFFCKPWLLLETIRAVFHI